MTTAAPTMSGTITGRIMTGSVIQRIMSGSWSGIRSTSIKAVIFYNTSLYSWLVAVWSVSGSVPHVRRCFLVCRKSGCSFRCCSCTVWAFTVCYVFCGFLMALWCNLLYAAYFDRRLMLCSQIWLPYWTGSLKTLHPLRALSGLPAGLVSVWSGSRWPVRL